MEQALRAPAPVTHLPWCRARLWPKMTGCVDARNVDPFQTHVPFQTHFSRHTFAPRDAMRPSRAFILGNAGCPLHPRPRVHFVLVERTRVTTSTPESPGIPARNGFNGLLRALVSAKSVRMCERAALTNRPSLDLSPWCSKAAEPDGERGTDPVSSSTRTVAWA